MRAYKTLDFELNYYEFDNINEMINNVNEALYSIDGLDWEHNYDLFEDCSGEAMTVYYTVNIHDDKEIFAILDALNFLPKTYVDLVTKTTVDRFTVQYGFVKSVDEYIEGV